MLDGTYFESKHMPRAPGVFAREPSNVDRNQAASQGVVNVQNLFERHHSGLVRYLLHFTGDRDFAEDLAQETWVRVLKKGQQYRGEIPFEFWLRRIARNLFIDWTRSQKVVRFSSLEDDCPLMEAGDSPLGQVLRKEAETQLEVLLRTLPEETRCLVREKFETGLTLRQLASAHGLNVSTVKSKIYRGLQTVRAPLESLRSERYCVPETAGAQLQFG